MKKPTSKTRSNRKHSQPDTGHLQNNPTVHGKDSDFSLGFGTRQECLLTPLPFSIVLEVYLVQWGKKKKKGHSHWKG